MKDAELGGLLGKIVNLLQLLHEKVDVMQNVASVQVQQHTTSGPSNISNVQATQPGPVPPKQSPKEPTNPEFNIPELEDGSSIGHQNPVFRLVKNGKVQDLTIESKDEMSYIDAELWLDPVVQNGIITGGRLMKIAQNDTTHVIDIGQLTREGWTVQDHTCAVVVRAAEDLAPGNTSPNQGQGETAVFDVI